LLNSLNSVGAKLQWYLSTLETILAKEDVEYRNRSKKTTQRLASLASSEEGKLRVLARMAELYDKRRRLVQVDWGLGRHPSENRLIVITNSGLGL